MTRVWCVPFAEWAESTLAAVSGRSLSFMPNVREVKPNADGEFEVPQGYREFTMWDGADGPPRIKWVGAECAPTAQP